VQHVAVPPSGRLTSLGAGAVWVTVSMAHPYRCLTMKPATVPSTPSLPPT
jgi:hypothetical protein